MACAVPRSLDDDTVEGMVGMGGGKLGGRVFLMAALLCVGVVQEACAKRVVRGMASLMASFFLLAFLEGLEVSVLDVGVVEGVPAMEGVMDVSVVEGVLAVEGVMNVGVVGGMETSWERYDYAEGGGVSLEMFSALVSLLATSNAV